MRGSSLPNSWGIPAVFPVTFEFFTIGVSVRLSDRSLHREEQKKSSKIVPGGD